jgi:hypothetical protein
MGRVIGNQPVIPVDVDTAHAQESKVCVLLAPLSSDRLELEPSRLAAHRLRALPFSPQDLTLSGAELSDPGSLSCLIS